MPNVLTSRYILDVERITTSMSEPGDPPDGPAYGAA